MIKPIDFLGVLSLPMAVICFVWMGGGKWSCVSLGWNDDDVHHSSPGKQFWATFLLFSSVAFFPAAIWGYRRLRESDATTYGWKNFVLGGFLWVMLSFVVNIILGVHLFLSFPSVLPWTLWNWLVLLVWGPLFGLGVCVFFIVALMGLLMFFSCLPQPPRAWNGDRFVDLDDHRIFTKHHEN